MTMYSRDHIWSSLVYSTVDSETSRIDRMHITLRLDDTLLVDQAEIIRPHIPERLCKRVDPEMIGLDRVSDCDVAAGTFVVVAVLAQPS